MADIKPQVAAAIRKHSEEAAQHGATILERADAIEAKLDCILQILERTEKPSASAMNAAVASRPAPPQPQIQPKPSK